MTRRAETWAAPTAFDPIAAVVPLPGSRSMTARALVLGAVSLGSSTLVRPLRSRDTEVMSAGLRSLGTVISTVDDGHLLVRPRPLTGPAHVDVGRSGTAMRLLPPLAAAATGAVTIDGDPRSRRRPLAPLVAALRALGVRVEGSESDGLPLTIHGKGRVRGGEVALDASPSSELISGLLLAAPEYERGLTVRHIGPRLPNGPHLRMTIQMLRAAGAAVDDSAPDMWRVAAGRLAGRSWDIEPDMSSAAPFLAAALVTGGSVTVSRWPHTTLQDGDRLREVLTRMGGTVTLTERGLTVSGTGTVHGVDVDLHEQGELSPVVAALAALADSPSTLRGVAPVRGHETDRVAALARELSALGTVVSEHADGLSIEPRPMKGTVFETYDDHSMAHAAAVLGLAVPGIVLSDVACTAKTLPEFPALWSTMVGANS
jgi:3-phosphoshikimate 1-carboxyvinyltransferase